MCLDERVCVLWLDGEFISCLAYGNGRLRTYLAGAVDPRAGAAVPAGSEDAMWSQLNAGAKCAVRVGIARRVLGWARSRFAS